MYFYYRPQGWVSYPSGNKIAELYLLIQIAELSQKVRLSLLLPKKYSYEYFFGHRVQMLNSAIRRIPIG